MRINEDFDSEVWLTDAHIRARYSARSRMWLHRARAEHGFPQAVKLLGDSGLNFTPLSAVVAWERRQAERARRAKPKPPAQKRRRAA